VSATPYAAADGSQLEPAILNLAINALAPATSLDLATVHGTIKQPKGAITVDSAPSKGSLCRVYLPC